MKKNIQVIWFHKNGFTPAGVARWLERRGLEPSGRDWKIRDPGPDSKYYQAAPVVNPSALLRFVGVSNA